MFTRSTLTVEGTDVFYRYNLMMGGNDANDPLLLKKHVKYAAYLGCW